jgi:hypothetical protein
MGRVERLFGDRVRKSDKMFCPHHLGGGMGLLASAHLPAKVRGDGLFEVDSNGDLLRARFCGPVVNISHGNSGRRSRSRHRAGSAVDRNAPDSLIRQEALHGWSRL